MASGGAAHTPVLEASKKGRGLDVLPDPMHADGIETVTFFSGARLPTAYLRGRLAAIVKVNPWLQGRFVEPSTMGGAVDVAFDERPSEASALDRVFQLLEPGALQITRDMPYADLCAAVCGSSAHVGDTAALLRSGAPFFRLTVVPVGEHASASNDYSNNSNGRNTVEFAIVMSLSRTIADGATYYKVLNMVLNAAPVQRLNFVRKKFFWAEHAGAKAVSGEDPYEWGKSCARGLNRICSRICGARPILFGYRVSAENVARVKQEAQARGGEVSSNDVVVSAIAKLSKPRVLTMPLNLRNRVSGVGDEDMGNYSSMMTYFPGDYETPELIRQSLTPQDGAYRRRGKRATHFPGCCASLCAREFRISNWAMSAQAGLVGCGQLLHLPVVEAEPQIEQGVIYRPVPSELAVMFLTRGRHASMMHAKGGEIFGELIH